MKFFVLINLGMIFFSGALSLISPRFVELFLGLLATFQLLVFIALLLKHKDMEPRLLSIGYLVGQIFCWVFATLGCIYLIEKDFQFGAHTVVTMVLVNLTIFGGILGSFIACPLRSRTGVPFQFISLDQYPLFQITSVFGLIYVIHLAVSMATGALTARWEVGNELSPSTPAYYVSALSFLQYPFFFFLGASCKGVLLNRGHSRGNILKIVILFFCTILSGTTGGREVGVKFLIYFIFGLTYSSVSSRQIKIFSISMFFFALTFFYVVGMVRNISGFGEVAMSEKISATKSFFNEEYSEDLPNSPFVELFSRLAEPSGQIVIDDVIESKRFIGFENIERLLFLFLPRFIVLEKKSADDGYERLMEDHGFTYNPFSSAPITFMADSFERGGYLAVFFISLTLSICLTFLGRLFIQIKNKYLRVLMISYFTVACIRIYSFSVLGCVSFLTYTFFKEAFILSIILMLSRFFLPLKKSVTLEAVS